MMTQSQIAEKNTLESKLNLIPKASLKWDQLHNMNELDSNGKGSAAPGIPVEKIPTGESKIYPTVINFDGQGSKDVHVLTINRDKQNLTISGFTNGTTIETTLKEFKNVVDHFRNFPVKTAKAKIPGVGVSYTKEWNLIFFI
jgi:hypothetical protein